MNRLNQRGKVEWSVVIVAVILIVCVTGFVSWVRYETDQRELKRVEIQDYVKEVAGSMVEDFEVFVRSGNNPMSFAGDDPNERNKFSNYFETFNNKYPDSKFIGLSPLIATDGSLLIMGHYRFNKVEYRIHACSELSVVKFLVIERSDKQ